MPKLNKICCVVGARPNFMKMAPIMRALQACGIEPYLVHTGQHYDAAMSDQFFRQLGIPAAHQHLEVGSGTHAVQTAEVMKRFESVVDEQKPDAVLVVGDVNSTVACALVASKKNVPVIHVEAGLRSFDRAMPEEINRIVTDHLSDILFATESSGVDNLAQEGITGSKVSLVGNVMIDTLIASLPKAVPAGEVLEGEGLSGSLVSAPEGYGVVTLHRPSNVDDPEVLESLLNTLRTISSSLPLIFVLHPRTRLQIEKLGLQPLLEKSRLYCVPPQGYFEMLGLNKGARVVLTDSGGLQEETTALGVPCLTLRDNTERPITVSEGTNTVVGTDSERVLAAFAEVMKSGDKRGRVPALWDGNAAVRIAEVLSSWRG